MFYQSKYVKIIAQDEILKFFHFMYIVANASEIFCMANLANIELILHYSKPLF